MPGRLVEHRAIEHDAGLAGLGGLGLVACTRPGGRPLSAARSKMPVVFLAHGAPMVLDDRGWMDEWAAWGRTLPTPNALARCMDKIH